MLQLFYSFYLEKIEWRDGMLKNVLILVRRDAPALIG
jgi:hypothetical protein